MELKVTEVITFCLHNSQRYKKLVSRQDKTTLLHFCLSTMVTDLAPQVAKANRGGPGTIK